MNNFDFNTHPFTSRLNNVKPSGTNKWICSCPCTANHKNGDKKQSLSVAYDPMTDNVLIYCHKGCDIASIVTAVGCSLSDLSGQKNANTLMKSVSWYANKNRLRLGDIYQYGSGLFKIRFYEQDGEKTFRWIHADSSNRFGYTWNREGYKPRLYVAGNLQDNKIIIVEGEKDANTVHRITGLTAVSSENGAFKPSGNKSAKDTSENKWCPEYNEQLTGKDVYILGDNDDAGKHFASIEATNLIGKANAVYMMDLVSVWSDCPENGDISDLAAALGDDEAKKRIDQLFTNAIPAAPGGSVNGITVHQAVEQPQPDTQPDNNLPTWIMETEYNGRKTQKINEPLFCEMFQKENCVVRINGVFYKDGEQVSDDLILSMIQKLISPYFPERTGRKTADLFVTLQNTSYVRQPTPDESKIYCGEDLTITIDDNGLLSFAHENIFTLSRLAINYDPGAECPTFMKYLSDLLYEEDIPAVQEYIGYCLIPSTRAQAGLFIHGQGGEGKSVLRDVMMRLFNHGAVQEGIHQLSERFVMANLENKLVCIDDDMRSDKLSDTAVIKKLITNSPTSPIQVERKNKQKYDSFIYARLFAIGNTFIGSKFDHSDGFYRRQLLIDCKPKTRPEDQDDRRMSDKCIAEIDGIFNWALAGLIQLVRNGYHFTVSSRMRKTLDDVKHEGNNALTFFEDDTAISLVADWTENLSSADMFTAYALWCYDNGETPVKRRSFLITASERYKIYKTRFDENGKRLQGFSHLKLSDTMRNRIYKIDRDGNRISMLDEKTLNRIERLP